MTTPSRPGQPRTSDPTPGVLARVSVPADGADPMALLRAFPGEARGFWQRGEDWAAWGGEAARLVLDGGEDVWERVREWADATAARVRRVPAPGGQAGDGGAPGPPPAFYGGFAFDPAGRSAVPDGGDPGDPWADVPAALFHLPRVELRRSDGRSWLSVIAAGGSPDGDRDAADAARASLEGLRGRLGAAGAPRAGEGAAGPGSRSPEAVREVPGREEWCGMVEASLSAISSGRVEKVVPARRVDLELSRAPDPLEVLERVRQGVPGTIPFLLQTGAGPAWVGGAPEVVAACGGGRFHATAVAGTAPDARDEEERSRLAKELLASAKDRAEHEIGVRDMRAALLRVAEVAEVDAEPRVLRLRGMQHLLTNLTAEIPPDLHVLEALAAMHPTAAVNGSPREEALEMLRELEPFGRGWYAGPVGWFDAGGNGVFAPGLRSTLLRGREAHLFAGAGIVEGSDPGEEWEETSLKLRPVLRALRVDPAEVVDGDHGSAEAGAAAGSGVRG